MHGFHDMRLATAGRLTPAKKKRVKASALHPDS
jgi:hypothetical protein